jgi:hypothetical protein
MQSLVSLKGSLELRCTMAMPVVYFHVTAPSVLLHVVESALDHVTVPTEVASSSLVRTCIHREFGQASTKKAMNGVTRTPLSVEIGAFRTLGN